MEKVLEDVMSLEKGLGRGGLWRSLQQSELSEDKIAKISEPGILPMSDVFFMRPPVPHPLKCGLEGRGQLGICIKGEYF